MPLCGNIYFGESAGSAWHIDHRLLMKERNFGAGPGVRSQLWTEQCWLLSPRLRGAHAEQLEADAHSSATGAAAVAKWGP